ncbi:MAG: HDOD domain-containing protein, partial [Thermodesulfobacteriota bacterium]
LAEKQVMDPIDKNKERLIQQIEELPSLPIISYKILDLVANKTTSFKELSKIIERDQAIAVKILKIANSSFYGFLGRVSSLEHALVLLGTKEVQSIVLGFSVYQFFSLDKTNSFDRTQIWKHAILCSQIAKYLGIYFRLPDEGSLFLSGLIHDIGKVVIDQYFHEEFLQIIDHISSNHTTFSSAEKKILGVTHYQIGATLLKQWNFPHKVIMPILYHHAPWYDKDYEVNSIILYLANILTKLSGYPCHQQETLLNLTEFAHSPEVNYINKSGFELDYAILSKLIGHIKEIVESESGTLMSLFQ